MVIRTKEKNAEYSLDLTGPEGNAFALMGHARKLARQLELDDAKILEEMTAGDYENLVETFDKYFGAYVVLYR